MTAEIPYLSYFNSCAAFFTNGTQLPLAKVWQAFRILRPEISLHEIKGSIKDKQSVQLLSFDPTSIEFFIKQLHALKFFYELMHLNEWPIRIVETNSQREINENIISDSISFHESYMFKITPIVTSLLDKLYSSTWVGCRQAVSGTNYEIVDDVPAVFDSLSEIMFAISSHVRQKLDDSGYHPDTLSHCYRIVGESSDGVVLSKFAGTSFENQSIFLTLIAAVIKLACAQLFYEVDGPREFEDWCNWMCHGLVPVGWRGTTKDGTLLLYAGK